MYALETLFHERCEYLCVNLWLLCQVFYIVCAGSEKKVGRIPLPVSLHWQDIMHEG